MPWTIDDANDHIQGLTQTEKKQWVKLANKVRAQCLDQGGDESTCDARAIKVANANYDQVSLGAENMPEKLTNKLAKKDLARFTANANQGGIRTDTLEGRPHLVIPVVALKEAVVKGQFLPGQEIRNSKNLWTDVPIPIHHPKNHSARELQIIDNRVVGRFYNIRVEENKLKGEIWIDEEKARNKAQQNNARAKEVYETYRRLKAGEPMDVSTSYWHDTVQESGTYKGKKYKGKQINLKPDHLAILPDEYGELSLPDGVGVPLKNQRGDDNVKSENQRSTARTPTYSNTSTESWSRQTLSEFAAQRGWDVDTVADMDDRQRRIAAESSLLGLEDADEWNILTFFQVVDGNGVLYKNALASVRGGRGQAADVPQSAYDSAAAKTKTLLQDEFDVEYSENSLSVIDKVFNLFRGEQNMDNKQELVEKIMEKAGTEDLSEGDLLDTKEEVLKAMAKNLEEGGGEEPEEEEGETEGPETDLSEENQSSELSEEKIMEIAKNAAREVTEQEKKENLVNKLANSDRVNYTKEELKKMPFSALKKTEQNAIPGNFVGAGGSLASNQGGTTEVELVETSGVLSRKEGE